jgi:hypothetical protein
MYSGSVSGGFRGLPKMVSSAFPKGILGRLKTFFARLADSGGSAETASGSRRWRAHHVAMVGTVDARLLPILRV